MLTANELAGLQEATNESLDYYKDEASGRVFKLHSLEYNHNENSVEIYNVWAVWAISDGSELFEVIKLRVL